MKVPNPSVQEFFSSIASRYDLTNDILSAGIHRLWKRAAIRACGKLRGLRVLDAATGTGDLALSLAKRGAQQVVGLDLNAEMLAVAKSRLGGASLPGLEFCQGDIQSLAFQDATFDRVLIAFGIRNVADPARGLRELWRVLRPGGKLIVLEFGDWKEGNDPRLVLFRALARGLIPVLGSVLTRRGDAYRYLLSSSSRFPGGSRFVEAYIESGEASAQGRLPALEGASYRAFFGGVAYLYCFEKAEDPAAISN